MKTTYIWCPECQKVVVKSHDGCPECGAPSRFTRYEERKQATMLMGHRAATNLNRQAAHAKYET